MKVSSESLWLKILNFSISKSIISFSGKVEYSEKFINSNLFSLFSSRFDLAKLLRWEGMD